MIMLSSESSAATEGATEDEIKPVVVQTYNKHMNGVDIADQYSTYYFFLRETSTIPQQAQLGGESSGDLLR